MANTTIQILRSYANTSPPQLDDGELAYSFASNTLFIGDQYNNINVIGGKSYTDKTNAAFIQANAAYTAANNVGPQIAPAFNAANSASLYANGAFIQANAVYAFANTLSGGNAIDNVARTSANAGFTQANAAFLQANGGFTQANAAFAAANTKFSSSGGAITGDTSITGNLTVIGTTTYANTQTVLIADNIITLNAAISQSGQPVVDAGFEIDRGLQPNASFLWIETAGKWAANNGNNSIFIAANSAESYANSAFAAANAAYASANNISNTLYGNTVNLGSNTVGQLVSNAVTLTTTTKVTDGLALINNVLGKLVPASPTPFPGATSLSISSLSTYRMANFAQIDNTSTGGRSVAGGTSVTSVRRASSYTTNTFDNLGPGDSGTLTIFKNGANSGAVTFGSTSANGTYSNLIITDSKDYSQITGAAAGFWRSFDAQGSGTVSAGWNEVYLAHTGAANTSTVAWYYDASAPGTPTFASASIVPLSSTTANSSVIPHYTSSATFKLGVDVSKLSGDMFPTSNTFFTGTAGGAFGAPTSNTYPTVGITYPLAQNLYVSSGSVTVNTTSTIISGFGSSSTGPSVTVDNSYATGSQAFTTALGATILYKTGNTSSNTVIGGEDNIFFGSTVGTGSTAAFRIANPGSTDTPAYANLASAFDSSVGPLQTYDATVVGATLKHDQTNYASGYLPAGPNLSTGRSGPQYFTFKFVRTSLSKFDIQFTGNTAGVWVAATGTVIDTTSSLNGWLSMTTAYSGSGIPGVNAPGNGSNGCALGGIVTANTAVTTHRKTCTFGTVSTSNSTNNEVYVRFKLLPGQTITALSLQTASN